MTTRDAAWEHYPVTMNILPEAHRCLSADQSLADGLQSRPDLLQKHPFLVELAQVEERYQRLAARPPELPTRPEKRLVNPTLEILEVRWSNLASLFSGSPVPPVEREEHLLLYLHPGDRKVILRPAADHDLLILKIVAEELDTRKVAEDTGLTIGQVDDLLYRGAETGLLLAPPSRLVRPADFPRGELSQPHYFVAQTFTLQWHITQACDLHCKHCYDRSDRQPMSLQTGIQVLDDLYDFCQSHNVFTQVTFTGGNPLLYPHFIDLYREAASRGFLTAVLGNPMPRKRIEEMLAIQMVEFYQVSLEGLADHNDYIRGPGHFDRVLEFLDLLRELGVYSMVMLTLTRDNMDQVLELAAVLEGRADLFTFNRLAMVGEGAALASVPVERFPGFLSRYQEAMNRYGCLGLKDNFFNLLRYREGRPYTGGCAGFGCGAAFNFLSLLPDGEVHACRKLPSYLGNIHEESLDSIYHGPLAEQYRLGSSGCRSCPIRPVCGGCLAVSYGFGRDIFTERDPYCFIDNPTG